MFIEMKHPSVAYADAFETAVAVKEAVIGDRDGGFGILDKTAVKIEPHAIPSVRFTARLCGLACASDSDLGSRKCVAPIGSSFRPTTMSLAEQQQAAIVGQRYNPTENRVKTDAI